MSGEEMSATDQPAAAGFSYYDIVRDCLLLLIGFICYYCWNWYPQTHRPTDPQTHRPTDPQTHRPPTDHPQTTNPSYSSEQAAMDNDEGQSRVLPEGKYSTTTEAVQEYKRASKGTFQNSGSVFGDVMDMASSFVDTVTQVCGSPQVKMKQITTFTKDTKSGKVRPVFHKGTVMEIISKKKCDKLPFLVISIIGPKRTGKSFLTNLLVSFLRYLEQDPDEDDIYKDGWLKEDVVISGVDWKQDRNAVTQGIWMWEEPFIVKRGTSKEMAVLLMDCQGLYDADDENEKAIDTLVTLFALKISKIHIVNMKGDVRSGDLEHLETCLTFSNLSKLEKNIKQLFNMLIILHRDWQEGGSLGYGGDYFVHLKSRRKGNFKDSEASLQAAFRECAEFMLPRPGSNITEASSGSFAGLQELQKNEESMRFLVWMNQLCLALFVQLPQEKENLTDLTALLREIERLSKHYKDGKNVLDFGSPRDVLEYNIIMEVLEIVKVEYVPPIEDIDVEEVKSADQLSKLLDSKKRKADEFIQTSKEEITCSSNHAEAHWTYVTREADTLLSETIKRKQEEFKQYVASVRWRRLMTAAGIGVGAVVGVATGGLGIAAGAAVMGVEVATATAIGAQVLSSVASASGFASWLYNKFAPVKRAKKDKQD